MPTMHRLKDLSKKQVLCLLHNAHLDFFCDNTEKAVDGKALAQLETHDDVQAVCTHVCRIQRNKLLREILRWRRAGVQSEEFEDRQRFFARAVEPLLEVQGIIGDLHARANEVGRDAKLLASPRARQQQMRMRGIRYGLRLLIALGGCWRGVGAMHACSTWWSGAVGSTCGGV